MIHCVNLSTKYYNERKLYSTTETIEGGLVEVDSYNSLPSKICFRPITALYLIFIDMNNIKKC